MLISPLNGARSYKLYIYMLIYHLKWGYKPVKSGIKPVRTAKVKDCN
jgi:hypothetical protein